MIRDTRVVNDPMRTGLNIIENIKGTSGGVIVTTQQPHGEKLVIPWYWRMLRISVNEVKN